MTPWRCNKFNLLSQHNQKIRPFIKEAGVSVFVVRGKTSGADTSGKCTEIHKICGTFTLHLWRIYGTLRARILRAFHCFFYINLFLIDYLVYFEEVWYGVTCASYSQSLSTFVVIFEYILIFAIEKTVCHNLFIRWY